MSRLESLLLLLVVGGLFALVIGIVMWANRAPPPVASAAPDAAIGADVDDPTKVQVPVKSKLVSPDLQDDLDARLREAERVEAEAAQAEAEQVDGE